MKFAKLSPKSLQERVVVYILVPVFIILAAVGTIGYFSVKNVLLKQWGETAIANLERTANHIDMQLRQPKFLLMLLQDNMKIDDNREDQAFIIERLRAIEGVVHVDAVWPKTRDATFEKSDKAGHGGQHLTVSEPILRIRTQGKTFSLVSAMRDGQGNVVGKIEVVLAFDTLLAPTMQASWWSIYKAYLVDEQGNILVSTLNEKNSPDDEHPAAVGTTGILDRETRTGLEKLEGKTLAALSEKASGTLFGPGSPPEEISGFYHLDEAPWAMVVIAPGEKVLQPIFRFRIAYLVSSGLCIVVIILLIRSIISPTTKAIREVSRAAGNLARGDFSEPIQGASRDEVGELIKNFNTMIMQLQRGVQLQKAMDIAREVQQTLLPQQSYAGNGITASGLSVYCDETGGDYFDLIESGTTPGRFNVVVGDVVGHGIGAALLMATLRGMLRARIDQPESPAELISIVNRQLCRDTIQSGSFSTLFYLAVDMNTRELEWIRAGHDPAILYVPATGQFTELKGKGLVLGVDAGYRYETNSFAFPVDNLVVLLGSDGVWEAENEQGEQFGKKRVQEIMTTQHHLPPAVLLQSIVESITRFRGDVPQADDITLVALSIEGDQKDAPGKKGA